MMYCDCYFCGDFFTIFTKRISVPGGSCFANLKRITIFAIAFRSATDDSGEGFFVRGVTIGNHSWYSSSW